MEYVALVFGIFGLFAYTQVSSLKNRVVKLEAQLASMEGTPAFEDRAALLRAAQSYIGKQVRIDFKEDQMDVDVFMYGNQKSGSNTLLDADEDWLLVRVDSARGSMDKLVRLGTVQSISVE